MPKRKRPHYQPPKEEVEEEEEEESPRSITLHQSTISQKIHHSRILLKRALKTAKGFEQQKLPKRLKAAAKSSPSSVERLQSEIEALKSIDLSDLANRHLNKLLLKNRALSSSKYFPPEISNEADEQSKLPVPTGPVANVCARMLNANPVKECIKEIIANLSNLLGIEEDTNPQKMEIQEKKPQEPKPTPKPAKSTPKEPEDSEETSQGEEEDVVLHPSMLKNLAAKYLRNNGAVSSDESEGEDDDRIAWSSEDSASEDEEEEEEEEEEEDSDSEDDRPRGRSMSITPIPEDQLRKLEQLEDEALDIQLSPEEEDSEGSEEEEEEEEPPKPKKQPAPAPQTGPIKSSSFLPTLLTGYISGSDSDTPPSPKHKKGPPEKKIRKNRMGQQARRALAEKMYGTGANHVKKAKEEKEAKIKAKEDRRKAWEEKKTKAVHVSWQIKQKDKDEKTKIMKEMMAGKTAGAGKKIVFD
ncbi:hypothetical protein TWF481_008209 [Arthrobotrys musiformis]|uniref:Bud22 domain-containing protein n=1 Tax=Arthrobotrys musiformis TaxID=47236 RepID=A0AAV9W6G0_9PEZI